MIGFEITIGNKTISGGIEQGVVSVIFDRLIYDNRNCLNVNFGGYNPQNNNSVYWCDESLSLGDKIVIRVKEITENSPTILRKASLQEKLLTHIHNVGIELTYKGETISGIVENGNIHLIISILNTENKNEIMVDFIAKDHISDKANPKKYWYKNSLQIGDELVVEIKEIEQNTLPLNDWNIITH